MMRRWAPAAAVLVAVSLGLAAAQDLGTVIFQPTAQQVLNGATGGSSQRIAPAPSSNRISFYIQAFQTVRVVVRSNIPTPFEIVADYSSTTRGAVPEVVLSTSQQTVFHGRIWWQARVDVAYWLVLTGPVSPGTYNVTVTYTLVGANSVTNTIQVVIPPVLALRVNAGATVAFDYAGSPMTYYEALGSTLPPTLAGTTLTSVDVWANGSYSLAAGLSYPSGGPTLPPGTIELLGQPIGPSGAPIATGSGTGTKYRSVVTPSDFAMRVTGTEAPGSYGAVVTYTLTSP